MKKNILIIFAVVIVALGAWYIIANPVAQQPAQNAKQPIDTAHYICDSGKTINAEFYKGRDVIQPTIPNKPPISNGSVKISLSDGRKLDLYQTISADGGRYSDGDPMTEGSESFVFWSKGNGALILENNEQKSYIGCITVKPDPGNLTQVYESGSYGFSIRYPEGYTANADYKYQEFGPNKDKNGVSFTIPPSMAEGTNLGQDTRISVEEISSAKECDAGLFLDQGGLGLGVTTTTDDRVTYSMASSTGAGAGNRYEEIVYAFPYTNPCIAVRYFVHYGVFENYPLGVVREFNEKALINQFDAIRRTLTINQ